MNVKLNQLLVGSALMVICRMIQAADEAKPDVNAVGPAVGDPLPEFESTDEQGLAWKSADHVGK